jgi:hypothetical protein
MFNRKKHGRGCRCAECAAIYSRSEVAAREFFARVDQVWPGYVAAVELMGLSRDLVDDWMSSAGQRRIAELRRDNPALLRDLFADALD